LYARSDAFYVEIVEKSADALLSLFVPSPSQVSKDIISPIVSA
jgi:hypothetical protein